MTDHALPAEGALVAAATARADAVAAETRYDHGILAQLRSAKDLGVVAEQLAVAFQYHAPLWRNSEEPFGPMVTLTDGTRVPPPLADVPEEICDVWAECAERSTHPLVRARLHDLLFERRWANRLDHARGAGEAYLELAQDDARSALERAGALLRSLELARRTAQAGLAARVVNAMVEAVRVSLSQPQAEPGVALRLLAALVRDRDTPDVVDELLDLARRAYPEATQTGHTIELQRKRSRGGSARTRALNREHVAAWISEAERAQPIVRVLHLEKAAKLAHDYGEHDLAGDVRRAMQAIRPDELGLQRITASTELPTEQVEEYIAQFIEASGWVDALDRLVQAGPPSGEAEDTKRQAEEHAREFVLSTFFPRMNLGGDGLPRYTPQNEEEQREGRVIELETFAIKFRGALLAEVLRRIGETFGPVSVDELAMHLEHEPHVPPAVARSLARAFAHYWAKEYEAAACVAMPKVESMVRLLLRALDEPLYRVQRQKAPGQYPGLGALLPLLRQRGLDESWHRYLVVLLSHPAGFNYRNELLHGFIDDVGAVEATLVLVAALFLARGVQLVAAGGQGDI